MAKPEGAALLPPEPRSGRSASGPDSVPARSLQSLLREQLAAAQRVIAASEELYARLGELPELPQGEAQPADSQAATASDCKGIVVWPPLGGRCPPPAMLQQEPPGGSGVPFGLVPAKPPDANAPSAASRGRLEVPKPEPRGRQKLLSVPGQKLLNVPGDERGDRGGNAGGRGLQEPLLGSRAPSASAEERAARRNANSSSPPVASRVRERLRSKDPYPEDSRRELPAGSDARVHFRLSGSDQSTLPSEPGTPMFERRGSIGSSNPGGNPRRSQPIFPDKEELKRQLRLTLDNTAYDVETFYHTTGFWQSLARNETFKNMTFVVIALNAVWIAIDTDFNKAAVLNNAPWEFQVGENAFCIYFCFELFARYKAFAKKRDAFSDGWFTFDSFLVILMIWSTWLTPLIYAMCGDFSKNSVMQNTSVFRTLRLFRLTRVARLARLLKDIPELMVLIKGMLYAMRAVFSTLCLLALVIYVFAILLTEMLSDSPAAKDCFENVPQSANCLLLAGVFSSQADLIEKLLAVHWTYYLTVLAYSVVGSMTIMNMLIGVIVQVMQTVSDAEKESLRASSLKDRMDRLLPYASVEASISQSTFREMMCSKHVARVLQEVNVDVLALVDLADAIFEGKESIGFEVFVERVLTHQGDKAATLMDLMNVMHVLEDTIYAVVGANADDDGARSS